jgi:hypothetical protein
MWLKTWQHLQARGELGVMNVSTETHRPQSSVREYIFDTKVQGVGGEL